MSEIRSIHSNIDDWENLVINIYQKPQSNEKDSRKDWRDIYHISVGSYKELSTIMKYFNQFEVIEINGGQRVVIPSTEEMKITEWEKMCDDLLNREVLKRVNPEQFLAVHKICDPSDRKNIL